MGLENLSLSQVISKIVKGELKIDNFQRNMYPPGRVPTQHEEKKLRELRDNLDPLYVELDRREANYSAKPL